MEHFNIFQSSLSVIVFSEEGASCSREVLFYLYGMWMEIRDLARLTCIKHGMLQNYCRHAVGVMAQLA